MVAVLRLCRWGRLFSGSVRGGACGPMGVPGAGGPGRCVCRWAVARPLAVRAASCCLLPRQISGRRAACPPARRPRRGWRPAQLMVLLVAPRVFRAPEAPAAREARQPHFVRCRASKPARALRSLRRPPHQWSPVCWRVLGASPRCPARPRRPRGGLQLVEVSVCCPPRPRRHGRRGCALRSLRRPPHRRRCCGVSVRVPPDLWLP